MRELLDDIRESILFFLAVQRSVAVSQIFRIVLLHGSDHTTQALVLEAIRSREFVEQIMSHLVLHRVDLPGFDFVEPTHECDGDCQDCDHADTSPPGDDDIVH